MGSNCFGRDRDRQRHFLFISIYQKLRRRPVESISSILVASATFDKSVTSTGPRFVGTAGKCSTPFWKLSQISGNTVFWCTAAVLSRLDSTCPKFQTVSFDIFKKPTLAALFSNKWFMSVHHKTILLPTCRSRKKLQDPYQLDGKHASQQRLSVW